MFPWNFYKNPENSFLIYKESSLSVLTNSPINVINISLALETVDKSFKLNELFSYLSIDNDEVNI